MPAALLGLSTSTCRFAAATAASSKRAKSCRHASVCASYRPGFDGFDANEVFRSAAQQFDRFQRQQQSSADRRAAAGKTNAAENSNLLNWLGWMGDVKVDPKHVSKFMEYMEKTFGDGDMSKVPSAEYLATLADQANFPAEVQESADEYRYLLDLPGVLKSDLKVQISKERVLSISGERKSQPDGKWKQVGGAGVRRGPFKRKFKLPDDADVANMRAKSENGVLVLTIKKVPQEDDSVTTVPIY